MEELPFYNEIPKYSHKLSTVPYHILFNPIHSQLTTIAYTCSSLDILVIEALKLVWILLRSAINSKIMICFNIYVLNIDYRTKVVNYL